MHPQPRRQLHALLRRYGVGLIHDPQRTEALLADVCGEFQREIFVLVHAQHLGVPIELSQMAGQRAEGVLRQRLIRRLQERYAFSDEAAAWAVAAWSEALNLRVAPISPSWLLGLWRTLRRRITAFLRPSARERSPAGETRPGISRNPISATPSLFGKIGVQWGKLAAPWLLLLLAVVLIGAGWTVRQANRQDIAYLFAFWQRPAAAQDDWQPPSPASAEKALAVHYPPPLEARIEADLLNVRAGPSLEAEVLGKVGPLGARVTVDGFSVHAAWSHIATPVAGWISNEFVTFAGDSQGLRVRLQPALGQVTQAGAPVRSQPRVDAPVTATLVAGQTLVLVALSTDGQWWQTVEPSPGWVESRYFALMER